MSENSETVIEKRGSGQWEDVTESYKLSAQKFIKSTYEKALNDPVGGLPPDFNVQNILENPMTTFNRGGDVASVRRWEGTTPEEDKVIIRLGRDGNIKSEVILSAAQVKALEDAKKEVEETNE